MKKYILTGLLVWLPLTITIWVMLQVLGLLDGVFAGLIIAAQTVLPESLRPSLEALKHIPGLSAIVMVSVLLLTGLAVTNFAGQWIVNQSNRVFSNIPIVKSIYSSVKQVSDTLFSSSGQAFRHAVLVQYPRAGSWTIGFVTGKPSGEVAAQLSDDHLTLYVPTTPNPTSGFMLIVPRSDVIELQMSVDEALKYIISMGVVAPPPHLVVDNTHARSHTG
ncbi:DUF502 domain-containing protein [Aquabacterium sp.]|uniref:DUF502 domain-containing protein n=1 Tax=Aquabacterium sp. TaxID=1872578 RepID=UPI003D6CFC6B